jgi:hypothetical protein
MVPSPPVQLLLFQRGAHSQWHGERAEIRTHALFVRWRLSSLDSNRGGHSHLCLCACRTGSRSRLSPPPRTPPPATSFERGAVSSELPWPSSSCCWLACAVGVGCKMRAFAHWRQLRDNSAPRQQQQQPRQQTNNRGIDACKTVSTGTNTNNSADTTNVD